MSGHDGLALGSFVAEFELDHENKILKVFSRQVTWADLVPWFSVNAFPFTFTLHDTMVPCATWSQDVPRSALSSACVHIKGLGGEGEGRLGKRGQIHGDRNLTMGSEHTMQCIYMPYC